MKRASAWWLLFSGLFISAPPMLHAQGGSTPCTSPERAAKLRSLQSAITETFPAVVTAFDSVTVADRVLGGYELSHGYAVLDGMGVTLVNVRAAAGKPELLVYRPAGDPADWSDADRADPPYTLVGWGYLSPIAGGPPSRDCLETTEWFIHEAGWHMRDGTMLVTPGATAEPARPSDKASNIWYWHPRAWDIHLWIDASGLPRVTLLDEAAPRGGLTLPGAFINHHD